MAASPGSPRGGGGGGGGGGGRRPAAGAVAERRRRLEEFLAAKGRLRAPSARPYLKDKSNQQTAAPSKPHPASRKDQGRVAPGKSKNAPVRKVMPAGPVLPARASCTSAAQKSQAVGSHLARNGPAPPLPSRPPTKSHSERLHSRGPSAGRLLIQTRKAGEGEQSLVPITAHGVHLRKAEGDKENATGLTVVQPGQKREASTFILPAELQTGPKGPAKKSRGARERDSHRNSQARPGWPATTQAWGKPRELPGGSWGSAPHGSVAGPFPQPGWSATVSRPTVKNQAPNPRVVKQAGACGVLAEGEPRSARGSSDVLPKGWSKQQANLCPALPGRRRPSNSQELGTTLKPSLTRSHSAAPGGISQSRSTAKRRQSSQRAKQLPRTLMSKSRPPLSAGPTAPAAGGSPGGRRGTPQSRQPAVEAGQAPKTPPPQDRRKLLEAWLASRGKSYKRPPMPPTARKVPKGKASLDCSFWGPLEEEEEVRKQQLHVSSKITGVLAECQKLSEEGVPSEELLAALSRIPTVERFAQLWICKAKLQARQATVEAPVLCKAAICAGAVPLQELQDAVVGILKDAKEPAGAHPTCASLVPEEEEEETTPQGPWQSLLGPQPPSAIKLQVLPLPRAKERSARSEVKLLTPVRRSLRIESSAACYPQMLKDHDPVVSSLEEILDTDPTSQFVFRNNEALPGGWKWPPL